nr:hypothetical protein [Rhodococcus oxybenzonivorans]
MHHGRSDGAVQSHVLAHRPSGHGVHHHPLAFGDQVAVPEGAILFGERDQLTLRTGACRAAGIGEKHQRQQTTHLSVVGQYRVKARVSRIA